MPAPPPLSFLQAGCPSCHPTNSVRALKVKCRAAIDQYLLLAGPTAANLQQQSVAGKWGRQADGWTPYCYIDPAPHTMLVALKTSFDVRLRFGFADHCACL